MGFPQNSFGGCRWASSLVLILALLQAANVHSTEGRGPKAGLPKGVYDVLEVVGFTANPRNASDLVALPNAANGRDCLLSCGHAAQDCQMVAYNTTSGACRGFIAHSSPWIESHVGGSSLLAPAMLDETYIRRDATDYAYGDILLNEKFLEAEKQGTMFPVSYGLYIDSEAVCKDLCTVHPVCNAVTCERRVVHCYLKTLTRVTPTANDHRVSFVLP